LSRLIFALLFILSWLTLPSRHLVAQTAPDTLTASSWFITNLVTNATDGFTNLTGGRVGDNGRTVVAGTRNGQTGLFIIAPGNVTAVATDSTILPGGLGTVSFIRDYGVAAQGDVLFTAAVAGGSLPAGDYAFRWSNGAITQQQPTSREFTHTPSQLTRDGDWLAEQKTGTFPNQTLNYQLTNGTASQPIFSFANSSADCVSTLATNTTPNANAVVAYYELTQSTPVAPGPPPRCANEQGTTRTWSIKLAGAVTGAIASGAATEMGTLTGAEADINNLFYLNNQNQVAWVRRVYDGSFATQYQLVVSNAQGGEQILLDTTAGAARDITLADFDDEGRVVLAVTLDDFDNVALLGGPSLASDVIIQTGQTLFGQTVTGLSVRTHAANAPTGTFGDRRNVVFTYGLQDSTTGIAVASKQVTRWANPAGGSWATAGNWSPAEVPGSASETIFNLDATYDVAVGTRQSGRSSVEAGSIAFQSADLTLLGPFSVGGAASMSLPEGKITANDLIVGHLPPINPAAPPIARVNITNNGTVFTATAQTVVGQAGSGDLFISGGHLHSGSALVGSGSPGTATVGGDTARWNITSLNVGAGFTATLNIESGGQVVVTNAAVIGQAATLQPYPARIVVDNVGVATPPLGNLRVNQLSVGDALPGTLDILNGGVVAVFGLLQAGSQAHNQVLPDARLVVEGTDGIGSQASALLAFADVLLGMENGARAEWQIFGGGSGSVIGNLHLGHEAGSRGSVSVSGRSLDGLRSQLDVGTATGPEICRVGFDGRGTITVLDGALVTCRNMNIGGNAGSQGDVRITGQSVGGTPSTLQVGALLCVGGAIFCGSGTNVPGTLTLQNGALVKTESLAVMPGGHLLGQGTVQALATLILGEVAPGIGVPPQPAMRSSASPAMIHPGALVISSSVELSPTAIIALDLHGADSYDRLVITGTAALAGQLLLNFGEGFAPKQGDTFAFIQATSATGGFTEVVITGLAAGFTYDLTLVNGTVTLMALNDGIATTQRTLSGLFLPLVVRP